MNGRSLARAIRFGLLGVGLSVLLLGLWLPTHVTAIPVLATARSDLNTSSCESGAALAVSFDWHGRSTKQTYNSPDCGRTYSRGDQLTIYAASNDAGNLGRNRDWILHPDEHDPFDFIGPNGFRGLLVSLGVLVLGLGGAWQLASLRNRSAARGMARRTS